MVYKKYKLEPYVIYILYTVFTNLFFVLLLLLNIKLVTIPLISNRIYDLIFAIGVSDMLENDMIFIRKTTEEDLPYILRTESDSENSPFIQQWTVDEHIDAIVQDQNLLHLTVISKDLEVPVGYLLVNGLLNENNSIELKRTAFSHKGRGYGRQMLLLIKSWAFTQQNANRLWLDVVEHNKRAKDLYKSAGFHVEGLQREAVKIMGRYESIYLMSILKEEYDNGL